MFFGSQSLKSYSDSITRSLLSPLAGQLDLQEALFIVIIRLGVVNRLTHGHLSGSAIVRLAVHGQTDSVITGCLVKCSKIGDK